MNANNAFSPNFPRPTALLALTLLALATALPGQEPTPAAPPPPANYAIVVREQTLAEAAGRLPPLSRLFSFVCPR